MLEKDYLRRWMREVMAERGWNAEEWAQHAQTTATNITRFLKGRSAHIPSYATLAKLAAAAGVAIPSPGLLPAQVQKVRLSLLTTRQIERAMPDHLQELASRARKSIAATDRHGPHAFAVVVDSGEYAAFGFSQGDVLVIDPDRKPHQGNHVFVYNGHHVLPCLYKTSFAIPATSDKRICLDDATVIGTVVELIRTMA
jgi:transcriptional regulator with XRE-family HTH domain